MFDEEPAMSLAGLLGSMMERRFVFLYAKLLTLD